MSSLTGQESTETQPSNPVNPGAQKPDPSVPFGVGNTSSSGLSSGTVDKSSVGQHNASDTSEQRSGADVKFNQQTDPKGEGDVGGKMGSESLIDSVERSVHERGEGEHSGAD